MALFVHSASQLWFFFILLKSNNQKKERKKITSLASFNTNKMQNYCYCYYRFRLFLAFFFLLCHIHSLLLLYCVVLNLHPLIFLPACLMPALLFHECFAWILLLQQEQKLELSGNWFEKNENCVSMLVLIIIIYSFVYEILRRSWKKNVFKLWRRIKKFQ